MGEGDKALACTVSTQYSKACECLQLYIVFLFYNFN